MKTGRKEKMNVRKEKDIKVVIGASFGDEGKGLMTDYFAHQASDSGRKCLVICSNGGAQRGHTVTLPTGKSHVFHHFGSGSFSGADTFLCSHFILNPLMFAEERKELAGKGICPRVVLHPDCRWSTPFDMIINQIVEEHRGEARHGSCGVGIWETVVRSRRKHLPFHQFQGKRVSLKKYLEKIRDEYVPERLYELGITVIPPKWQEVISAPALIEHYIEDYESMLRYTSIGSEKELFPYYDRLIFENGQGLLLDKNRKEYGDHTTPSHTGLKNPAEMIAESLADKPAEVEVCYVTRTYLTRHGAGPMPGECPQEEIADLVYDETNVPNPFQGRIRYGKIEPEALKRNILKDYSSHLPVEADDWRISLAVTHLNETEGCLFDGKNSGVEETFADKIHHIYLSDGKSRETVTARTPELMKQSCTE